jgi:hypothetical protein
MFKKTILLIVVLILTFTMVTVASDFRNVEWGMSKSEVINSEDMDIFRKTDELIIYKTDLFDKEFLLAYFFEENKLIRTRYLLNTIDNNISEDKLWEISVKIPELMTEKYGESVYLYRGRHYQPEQFLYEVAYNDFKVESKWETKDTEIFYNLESGPKSMRKIANKIDYYPKDEDLIELREKGKEEDKEKNKNQL